VPTRNYVDIHILQTVPPSNLNRDDAGSPKQAVYGGVRRARVSSQAWKRAARKKFVEQVPEGELAVRTKRISSLLATRLAARTGLDAESAARVATQLLTPLGIKAGKKATETAYLLFFGRPQIDRLVDLVADRADELAALDDKALAAAVGDLPVKEQLASGHPIDVALFGRMVADIPGLNVDAATQVAHALSTHAVETEFDYFTAVDDENTESMGAGMIGTVEFNSATLYRFATVGVHQLLDNLGGDVEATTTALEVFLAAFAYSMPSGHQNTFGNRTLPALVSVVLRDDQPVNLVSAFEQPVPHKAGIVAESVKRLVVEMGRTSELWGPAPVAVWSTYAPSPDGIHEVAARDTLGAPLPFKDVISAATESVQSRLASGEA
jgi:CRISPR system Cascade subunit CasC